MDIRAKRLIAATIDYVCAFLIALPISYVTMYRDTDKCLERMGDDFLGTYEFFINIKTGKDDASSLLQDYNNNEVYQAAFHCGILDQWVENGYNVGISAVIDSFLPVNLLIFKLLSAHNREDTVFYIKTRGIERIFDFEKQIDFFNFMYNVWEDKINVYYKQMGGILLSHKNYCRTRNKLFKKYYMKL